MYGLALPFKEKIIMDRAYLPQSRCVSSTGEFKVFDLHSVDFCSDLGSASYGLSDNDTLLYSGAYGYISLYTLPLKLGVRYKLCNTYAEILSYAKRQLYTISSPCVDMMLNSVGHTNAYFVRTSLLPFEVMVDAVWSYPMSIQTFAERFPECVGVSKVGKRWFMRPAYLVDISCRVYAYYGDKRDALRDAVDTLFGKGTWDLNPVGLVYDMYVFESCDFQLNISQKYV